jgi:prephenate dehydrogenase
VIQQVAIIGAGGKMGSWFLEYFSKKRGIRLSVYDINAVSIKPSTMVIICESVCACVKNADLVLICVPISSTPLVIKECVSNMKTGAVLAEISSIKGKTFATLKKYSKNIIPLCIHPMFGPGASSIKDTKVLMIPVKNKENELKILYSILGGANIIVLRNARIHDKCMAIILGLTYYSNIVFANLLSKEEFPYLEKISGTSFRVQLLLIESILTDDPELIVSIISENLRVRKYIHNYVNEADRLRNTIYKKNSSKIRANLLNIKSIFEQSRNLQTSYRQLYDILGTK